MDTYIDITSDKAVFSLLSIHSRALQCVYGRVCMSALPARAKNLSGDERSDANHSTVQLGANTTRAGGQKEHLTLFLLSAHA